MNMTLYRVFPVFSVVFAVLYLVASYFNLALITYHPALKELDLLVQPPKAGPAMYWYGWITTAAIGAFVASTMATFVPDRWDRWVQWVITFAFVYAVLYVIVHYLALFIYDQATVELEFLKHPATSAAGAFVAAVLASIFFPVRWTRRLWSGWTGVIPLSVMLVFVFLLRGWFMPSVGVILR
jgi:hypothetical protein